MDLHCCNCYSALGRRKPRSFHVKEIQQNLTMSPVQGGSLQLLRLLPYQGRVMSFLSLLLWM